MSSNLDPNTDLDRPQIDNGPGTSGIQDKKKNKKEVKLFYLPQTKIYPHPAEIQWFLDFMCLHYPVASGQGLYDINRV